MALKGNVAILSGGTRGIGKAIAIELAKEGCHISFNYFSSSNEAQAVEEEIRSHGVNARSFKADIKDYAAVQKWVDQTREHFGAIDIVINNAGILRDKALAFMAEDDWKEVISTNLEGTINLSRATVVSLLKQRSGSIINMTSVSGVIGLARQTNYSASKAGIIGFTKSLARELGGYNVRVNAVAPGFIETDMLKGLREDHKKVALSQVPQARFGQPEEVAQAVKFLADPERSGFITGQTLVLDGGLSIAL